MTREIGSSAGHPAAPRRAPRRTSEGVASGAESHEQEDRLIKAAEAARLLDVSLRMVYRLIATGGLPRVKIGKATRFRMSDIESLMQRGAE